MRTAILLSAMALAACASKGERAEQEYKKLLVGGGSPAQVCTAAQHVADTYAASEEDVATYHEWQNKAQNDCSLVNMSEQWLGLAYGPENQATAALHPIGSATQPSMSL